MPVTFNKPPQLKYTDMAIYIDEHMEYLRNIGQYPEVESKVFEYLYHITYALARKSMYFKHFGDYDNFALNSASELYLSIRNKLINAGKVVRGKEIKPVKSSLNFIKAVLYPLKIQYQNETFATVLDPQLHSNVLTLTEKAREAVQISYRRDLIEAYTDTIKLIPKVTEKILAQSPYRNDLAMIKKLNLSCILTMLNDLTPPEKLKQKITKKLSKNKDTAIDKLSQLYASNIDKSAILWHLDPKYSDYVVLLTRKIRWELSKELEQNIHDYDLSEDLLSKVMDSAYSTYESLDAEKE